MGLIILFFLSFSCLVSLDCKLCRGKLVVAMCAARAMAQLPRLDSPVMRNECCAPSYNSEKPNMKQIIIIILCPREAPSVYYRFSEIFAP